MKYTRKGAAANGANKKGMSITSSQADCKEERRSEFNSIVRDIRKLTFSSLGKFEQLKIRDAEMKATGRKADKKRRMPLPELRLRRAAAERSIQKQIEKEQELGVTMFHGKKTLDLSQKYKKMMQIEKKKNSTKNQLSNITSLGRDRGGLLKLNSSLVKKYSST